MERPYAQSADNHARIVPLYHGVTLLLLAVNLIWSLYQAVVRFSWGGLVTFGVAFALLVMFFFSRQMALTVQDRVIRLEERLRMERLLPPDLRSRIDELTIDQIISLRFASDAELPDLTRRVLDEQLTERKAIKKLIRTWRPDFLRA